MVNFRYDNKYWCPHCTQYIDIKFKWGRYCGICKNREYPIRTRSHGKKTDKTREHYQEKRY